MDDMRQLTIRLNSTTLNDLEKVVDAMQKDGPVGVVYTRTDALRNVIMRGIASYIEGQTSDAPAPPAASKPAVKKRPKK